MRSHNFPALPSPPLPFPWPSWAPNIHLSHSLDVIYFFFFLWAALESVVARVELAEHPCLLTMSAWPLCKHTRSRLT